MDFASLTTIIGIIILLAALGLLKPLRNLFGGLGEDVEVVNQVKSRLVKEWDMDSAVAHAKKMNKTYNKIQELGEISTYEENMKLLKSKRHLVAEED